MHHRELVEVWEAARERADRSRDGFILVLDEIQLLAQWASTVKGLWDADRLEGRSLHVVLLGSAPLRIQAQLDESLAGRFETIPVRQWSLAETREAFGQSVEEYLFFGGYPGAVRLAPTPDRWREFVLRGLVQTSIERDVVSMTRVRKPALLQRVFRVGTRFSGQILSYSKLVGHLSERGNIATVQAYLDLLDRAGLLAALPSYSGNLRLDRRSSPKLVALDPALMTAGFGYSFEEAVADRTAWGRIAESAVGAHLVNTATSRIKVSYWRQGSSEVDYVMTRGPETIGIGVKSGRQRRSVPGLAAFRKRFRAARGLIVGSGGVPLERFLSVPASHWFDMP